MSKAYEPEDKKHEWMEEIERWMENEYSKWMRCEDGKMTMDPLAPEWTLQESKEEKPER